MSDTLKAKEIVKLVKALRESGVSTFEGVGLRIVIGSEAKPSTLPTVAKAKAADRKAEIIEQDSILKDELEESEDQLDMLLLNDPSAYERGILEGELTDEGRDTFTEGFEPALQ